MSGAQSRGGAGRRLVASDSERGLGLWHSASPSPGFVARIEATEWGTDGLKVQNYDVPHELTRLGEADYFDVESGAGKVVATFALVPNVIGDERVQVASRYRCLMSVDPALGGKGVGSLLGGWIRAHFVERVREPTLFHGFIESKNQRSLAVAKKTGYASLGTFEAVNIGWFRPRRDARARPMRADERAEVLAHLRAARVGHVAPQLERGFFDDEMWVLEDGGKIIAGAQVVDKRVRVTALEGLSGKVLMAVGPLLARTSRALRLFELRNRRVPWLGNMFALPGAERELPRLFAAVQAARDAHALVSYFDVRTPLHAALDERRGFGPLAKIAPKTRFEIMAGAVGGAEPHWGYLAERPWWFSPLECI